MLDEIVRDGRQMLQAALKAEVAAYIEQFVDQLDDNASAGGAQRLSPAV